MTNRSVPKSALATTAFRAAAIVVAVFSLVAAAIMWFVSNQTNQAMTKQALAALTSEAKLLKAEARRSGLEGLRRAVLLRSQTVGSGLYYLGETGGKKIAGNLRAVPSELEGKRAGGVFRYIPHKNPTAASSSTTGAETSTAPARMAVGVTLSYPGVTLIVARDVEAQRELAYQIRWVSLLGFGLLGIGGLAAGLIMSRLALARVNEITDASRAIMAGNLSERLPLTGSGDEFDRLAQSLNEMLSRIEQLMLGLREVSDNIAHDLKTPLNRLRNRAEEAMRDPRGPKAHKQGLERTIEAADDLMTTFNALLLIAKLEAGAVEKTFETIDIVAVANEVAELYEPVASDAGMSLQVEGRPGPETVMAINRQLIGQSIANLIDNAIKYTKESQARHEKSVTKDQTKSSRSSPTEKPENSAADSYQSGTEPQIQVSVAATQHGVEISVGDRGPGIAQKDRGRVLKRFVRLEKSRTAPGTGLGLSLVAAVARLHGATVRLEDNSPGLRVVIALPRRQGNASPAAA